MDRMKIYMKFILIGAAAYWLPDIIIHIIAPPHYVWISLLTFLVPIIVFYTCHKLSKKQPYTDYPASFPLLMLFGIWFFGPLAIGISVTPAGGTFFTPDNLSNFFYLWSIFPATTFMMSTYSGSLGGVLIATIVLLTTGVKRLLTRPSTSHASVLD